MDAKPVSGPQTETQAPVGATSPADFALWHALYRLETAYWRDVDLNQGRGAHAFYVPDGTLVVGHNRFHGREEIRAFYQWRERQSAGSVSGATTTRHLVSNLYVEATADGRAQVAGIVSLYGGVIRQRMPQSKPPILLADLCNECLQDEDGHWRFVSHVLKPVFVSQETALSMAIDTRLHRAWAAHCATRDP